LFLVGSAADFLFLSYCSSFGHERKRTAQGKASSIESADVQVVVSSYDDAEVTDSFFSELEKEPLIGGGGALIFEEIYEVRQDFDIVEYLVTENLYVCSLAIFDVLHTFDSAMNMRVLIP
jgi:hypothetical protein